MHHQLFLEKRFFVSNETTKLEGIIKVFFIKPNIEDAKDIRYLCQTFISDFCIDAAIYLGFGDGINAGKISEIETKLITIMENALSDCAEAYDSQECKSLLALGFSKPESKQINQWELESVDRYYQETGRNYDTYFEVSHYYCKNTLERTEKVRSAEIQCGQRHSLPIWAQGITKKKPLN